MLPMALKIAWFVLTFTGASSKSPQFSVSHSYDLSNTR